MTPQRQWNFNKHLLENPPPQIWTFRNLHSCQLLHSSATSIGTFCLHTARKRFYSFHMPHDFVRSIALLMETPILVLALSLRRNLLNCCKSHCSSCELLQQLQRINHTKTTKNTKWFSCSLQRVLFFTQCPCRPWSDVFFVLVRIIETVLHRLVCH